MNPDLSASCDGRPLHYKCRSVGRLSAEPNAQAKDMNFADYHELHWIVDQRQR